MRKPPTTYMSHKPVSEPGTVAPRDLTKEDQRMLATLLRIKGLPWTRVGEELGVSWQWARHICLPIRIGNSPYKPYAGDRRG